MTRDEALALVRGLTYEEKIRLRDLLQAMKQERSEDPARG